MDARKTLNELENEWSDCTKCALGEKRKSVNGQFVFGEGVRRSIMFIGEGPGAVEEEEGRPFVGPSGKLIRGVLEKLEMRDYYMTNCVTCRSCAQAYDGLGHPVVRLNRRTGQREPVIRDEPPTPLHIQACLPRLHEQIYLVDPILIVALGGGAAQTLRGKSVAITTERGTIEPITIPGAWNLPSLTEKKRVWLRKVSGNWVMPTTQNEVTYSMLMTLHPAYVLRMLQDRRLGNPLEKFVEDIKTAVGIYRRYLTEAYGSAYAEYNVDPEEFRENDD